MDDVVKESSYEKPNGGFWVPRRTTAVFVEDRRLKEVGTCLNK